MTLQYIVDKSGTKKAVQIPIRDWNKFLTEHKKLIQLNGLKSDLTQAFREIKEIESGKRKAKSLKQFLNEL